MYKYYFYGYAGKAYGQRLEGGLCPTCGGSRDDGWINCGSCREKNRSRLSKLTAEIKKIYNRTYRKKARRKNQCYVCNTELADTIFKACEPCRVKHREHTNNHKGKLRLLNGSLLY